MFTRNRFPCQPSGIADELSLLVPSSQVTEENLPDATYHGRPNTPIPDGLTKEIGLAAGAGALRRTCPPPEVRSLTAQGGRRLRPTGREGDEFDSHRRLHRFRASGLAQLFGGRVDRMGQSTEQAETTEHEGLNFYGPDDELPPGAMEALKRRTPEELRAVADRTTRRS